MSNIAFRLVTKWFTIELTRVGFRMLVNGLGSLVISAVLWVGSGQIGC